MSAASNLDLLLAADYARLYPVEFAEGLSRLSIPDAAAVLADLDEASAPGVFGALSPSIAIDLITVIDPEVSRELLRGLELPRATSLLAGVAEPVREGILKVLEGYEEREIRQSLDYPPGSVGRLMDTSFLTVQATSTVRQAIEQLRKLPPEKRISNVHIVDLQGKLCGIVSLQDAALASEEAALAELMTPPTATVTALTPRDEIVQFLNQHHLASVPVVDLEGHPIGVVRLDQLVTAAAQEATADLASMVGAGREERALSKVSFAVRKRLPWLQINLATAFLAASVVGVFEETIAQFTALAVLLPVVAGQSGNTGAQALAVVLRGLALREISLRHWRLVVTKELGAAIVNGFAVAAVTCLGVYVWSGSGGLTIVIGVAMVVSMGIAGAAGAAVPIVLSALGQDPAQSSSIILTTVTDVFGFFSFLGLATLLASIL